MREESLLDSYVERLRGDGKFDSEGSFTMASDRALGTLSHFLLPNPGDWLLKIVQAACAGGAPELHIKQTRASTQVRFRLPGGLDLTALENSLANSNIPPANEALGHLFLALRAVSGEKGRDWVARVVRQAEETLLQCAAGKLSAWRKSNDQGLQEMADFHLAVAYPQGEFGKLGGLIRFGECIQEEHQALLTRARACPIPLTLDGERIDDLREHSLQTALQQRLYLGVLHTALEPGSEANFRVSSNVFDLRPSTELNEVQPFFLQPSPAFGRLQSLQRWYYNYTILNETPNVKGVHQSVAAGSRVVLIRDGVEVGSRTLNLHHAISVDVLLNAAHLRTDITGLKVEPEHSDMDLGRAAIRNSGEAFQKMKQALTGFRPGPSRKSLWLYGGMGALGLLMPTFAFKAAAGTASLLLLNRSSRAKRKLAVAAATALKDFERQIWRK